MDDFKSQFRAAKAARSSAKPSKEQLRALKAQKAATDSSKLPPCATEDKKTMPPPPPRATTSLPHNIKTQGQEAASFHADSQATILQKGGITGAGLLESEASVNKNSSRAPGGDTNAANGASVEASNALPASLFEAAGQGSCGGAGSRGTAGAARATRSMEGSTGGADGGEIDDGRSGFNAADLATSALSAKSWGDGTASSHAVQAAGVFSIGSMEGDSGSLPQGFFDPQIAKNSQKKQQSSQRKDAKEMDREFADFIKEVEVEAATAATAEMDQVDDDAEAGRHREEFEQFVRAERLRELREQKVTKRPAGGIQEESASALEIAGIIPEAAAPIIVLPKRRRAADTAAVIAGGDEGLSSDGDEDPDELLDWRAKKSA